MITETNLFSILQFLRIQKLADYPQIHSLPSRSQMSASLPFSPKSKDYQVNYIRSTVRYWNTYSSSSYLCVFVVFFNSKYKAVVIKQTWWYKQYSCSLKRKKKNEKSRKAIKWCMYNLLQQKQQRVLETVYCKCGRKKRVIKVNWYRSKPIGDKKSWGLA